MFIFQKHKILSNTTMLSKMRKILSCDILAMSPSPSSSYPKTFKQPDGVMVVKHQSSHRTIQEVLLCSVTHNVSVIEPHRRQRVVERSWAVRGRRVWLSSRSELHSILTSYWHFGFQHDSTVIIKSIYKALLFSADVTKCCTETQPKTPNSKQCRCRSTVARKNSLERPEPRKKPNHQRIKANTFCLIS